MPLIGDQTNYRGWSETVREVAHFVTGGDALACQAELKAADPTAERHAAICGAIYELTKGERVAISDLARMAFPEGFGVSADPLGEKLKQVAKLKAEAEKLKEDGKEPEAEKLEAEAKKLKAKIDQLLKETPDAAERMKEAAARLAEELDAQGYTALNTSLGKYARALKDHWTEIPDEQGATHRLRHKPRLNWRHSATVQVERKLPQA